MPGLVDLAFRYLRFVAAVIVAICVALVVSLFLSYVAYHTGYDVVLVSNTSGILTTLYVFFLAWNLPSLQKKNLRR